MRHGSVRRVEVRVGAPQADQPVDERVGVSERAEHQHREAESEGQIGLHRRKRQAVRWPAGGVVVRVLT